MIPFTKRILAQPTILALVILFLFAAAGLGLARYDRQHAHGPGQPVPLAAADSPISISPVIEDVGTSDMSSGTHTVSLRLSAGQAQPQAAEPLALLDGAPLTPEEIAAIVQRLPSLPGTETVEFRLPAETLPPPLTGGTLEQPFPPVEALTVQPPAAGPLEVLRYSPQGPVELAPLLSVTFNQPMVALDTLAGLAAQTLPVQIEPALPGTWRWLGTRTLTFEYDSSEIDRLPQATEYRVTIPAGTRAASGAELGETVSWTFTTPPPQVAASYPVNIPQPLQPLIFLAFNQRIDPGAVLSVVRLEAGGRDAALELVGQAEIDAVPEVAGQVKAALPGRWLVFRPVEALPPDTAVNVTVGPGVPSAEGPLANNAAHTFSFRTYAPLSVVEHYCGWHGSDCPPLTPFYIQFNNPLDVSAYTSDLVTIDPELPGASVNIYGSTLSIQGQTQGRTEYRVTLGAGLRDVFGQTLGSPVQLTFRVGPAEQMLFGPQSPFVTLDPTAERPLFSVYSINYPTLDVSIYAVQPDDWPAFQTYMQDYGRTDRSVTPPGRLVRQESVAVNAPGDALAQTDLDLSPLMEGRFGHFVVIVSPPSEVDLQERTWRTLRAWVQVTHVGLDALVDHTEMLAWATDLSSGAPLAGVNLRPGPQGSGSVTGGDGLARFPIPSGATYLVATLGADQALLPRSLYAYGDDAWRARPLSDQLRWMVFDDRGMYRPGEQARFKGFVRRVSGGQTGDVGLVGAQVSTVTYQVYEPQGNLIAEGQAALSALGGFDFALDIPAEANLGYAQVMLSAPGFSGEYGNNYQHSFQIQEFRRPEFEVRARTESPGPHFVGEAAVTAVSAQYYAGGPLPNAEVTWLVSTATGHYAPPNWPEFTFGRWQPRWWWFEAWPPEQDENEQQTFDGVTDANGEHFLRLDFDALPEPAPLSVTAEATVMDVNRQAWTGTTTLLVHPASLYVGLRSQPYFVQRGQPINVEAIVTDLDGNAVSGQAVEIRAARMEWQVLGSDWQQVEKDEQLCTLVSAGEPLSCRFETPVGGEYQITANVRDPQGRLNESQLTRWVSGGERPPSRQVEQEEVTLIPNQDSYQPGETASLLVQAPFAPAEGLLTVSRDGILYTQRFSLPDGSATLEIPIAEAHIPNLNVQVDVVGSAPRLDDLGEPLAGVPPRPAYATASMSLSIPPLSRTLGVQLNLGASELEPGGETVLQANVFDAAGQPVAGAELAVVVVDEAILALSSYQMADPLSIFYSEFGSGLASTYGRASLVLADPRQFAANATDGERQALGAYATQASAVMEAPAAMPMEAAMPQADMSKGGGSQEEQPIAVRSDFNPLAVFVPAAATDANGQALIPIKLPDNLTRYRVMVVAVDAGGRQFGQGESSLTARLALMVRPSPPRFLNFGDQFELPVVLQNGTGEAMDVSVIVQTTNLALTGANGLRVTIPARDRVEVRFPAAAQMAGTAALQIAAVSTGGFSDAARLELPVYTPATTEAFATYGVVDEGAIAQPLASPTGVFPQFGGLEIQTSSTAVQALTDAVLYLSTYPFDCAEQIASRLLAIAALRDVLSAFQAEGLPAPAELEASVAADIDRLHGMQNGDGGFPYWRPGYDSIPFNTIHVTHALLRAQSKSFDAPEDTLANALSYLRDIESHYPHWYDQHIRYTLSAYALYVRRLAGESDPQKALNLIQQAGLENLSLDALGWLWPVLGDDPGAASTLDELRRIVANRVVETPGAANFATEFSEQDYLLLRSDRRTDAILLDALIGDQPQSDLIPKLVNGLLAHRTAGRWGSTQENVFVLLSLDRYFNTYEAQTPDFVARLWLGESYAGSHTFSGRSTERQETVLPMSFLTQAIPGGEQQNIIIAKEGAGRLYYRLGLRYAPEDLDLDPLEMGFSVTRTYEAVDNPDDVRQDENGVWHIRAGSRVRVRLTMMADNRRYHVALTDPLPAGLEAINPGLDVMGGLPQDPQSPEFAKGWWWLWPWYEHQNLRDQRAEAFTSLLWEGVYEYSYVARATTPGTFIVPPAKAEEMYSPEVFGRSGSDVVVVE